MRRIPTNCDRCQAPMPVSKMSKFNTDMLCLDCITEEREAPGYKAAADEEYRQVVLHNYKFPGVGLDPLSLGFVCGRMSLRGIGIGVIAAYAKKHGYPYPEGTTLKDLPGVHQLRADKEKGPSNE